MAERESLDEFLVASFLGLSLEGALDRDKTLDDLEQDKKQIEQEEELTRRAEEDLLKSAFDAEAVKSAYRFFGS